MNKAERHRKKMVKFKKRLKQMGLTGKEGNHHSLRTTGKPCSCYMCSTYKYRDENRSKEKQEIIKKLKTDLNDNTRTN